VFLFPTSLTTHRFTNFRVSRTKRLGISPKGAPTYLAFLTDAIRHLFKKVTDCGLFFHQTEATHLAVRCHPFFAIDPLSPIGRWWTVTGPSSGAASDCTLKQPYSTVPPIDPNAMEDYRTVTFYSPVFQLSSSTKALVLDGLIPHISLQRLVYRDSGWAKPLSLAATNGISVDFFSSR